MEKYVPYQKLSKKKKKEVNARYRGTWGILNPTTRKPDNSKAYNRKKTKLWEFEDQTSPFFMCIEVLPRNEGHFVRYFTDFCFNRTVCDRYNTVGWHWYFPAAPRI